MLTTINLYESLIVRLRCSSVTVLLEQVTDDTVKDMRIAFWRLPKAKPDCPNYAVVYNKQYRQAG